jgi:hypothetical protein
MEISRPVMRLPQLERTAAVTNEVLEPIKFVLAYLTLLPLATVIFKCFSKSRTLEI